MIQKLFKRAVHCAILCLTLAFVPMAQAQTYGTVTFTAVPAVIQASTTTNILQALDCRYNKHIAFELQGMAGATNTTLTVSVMKGLDGSTFESTNGNSISLVLNISTNALAVTNIDVDVGAVGWLQIGTAKSGNNVVSNALVRAALKPNN